MLRKNEEEMHRVLLWCTAGKYQIVLFLVSENDSNCCPPSRVCSRLYFLLPPGIQPRNIRQVQQR